MNCVEYFLIYFLKLSKNFIYIFFGMPWLVRNCESVSFKRLGLESVCEN